jgi:hypothetical protein
MTHQFGQPFGGFPEEAADEDWAGPGFTRQPGPAALEPQADAAA